MSERYTKIRETLKVNLEAAIEKTIEELEKPERKKNIYYCNSNKEDIFFIYNYDDRKVQFTICENNKYNTVHLTISDTCNLIVALREMVGDEVSVN